VLLPTGRGIPGRQPLGNSFPLAMRTLTTTPPLPHAPSESVTDRLSDSVGAIIRIVACALQLVAVARGVNKELEQRVPQQAHPEGDISGSQTAIAVPIRRASILGG
jgi:hypothetical protein